MEAAGGYVVAVGFGFDDGFQVEEPEVEVPDFVHEGGVKAVEPDGFSFIVDFLAGLVPGRAEGI